MAEPTILGPDGNPTPKAADAPKIHVDSDWKAQAQAEKERLAKLEEEKARERSARGDAGSEELPPADFRSLVGVLASQAIMGLGAYGDEQGRMVIDLVGSRFAIDLIAVLEEKTKGNLSPEESKHLQGVLGELRSRYVQIATVVAQQMKAQGAAAASGVAGRIDGGRIEGGGAPRRPIIETP
ncbi:MAG: DUF1844 domain-containing protein [Phycisphaerales bacterium]